MIWRKRVGVEPTIHPAKGRIAGFEGREDHRTPCASVYLEPDDITVVSGRPRRGDGMMWDCGGICKPRRHL